MPPTQDFLKLYPISILQTTGAWSDGKALETKALIDGTPEYLYNSVAAPRIRAVAPQAKFVIILRVRISDFGI